jgi:hypothetical protein
MATPRKPKDQLQKRGRKSKYGGIDKTQYAKLYAKGFTDAEVVEFFNVSPASLYRWKKAHPEFREEVIDWKKAATEKVVRSLYERAIGYEHKEDAIFQYQGCPVVVPTVKHYPPDTAAIKLWLINRDAENWSDKQEIDNTHRFPEPIEVIFTDSPRAKDEAGNT